MNPIMTKSILSFAYVVVASGALMGISMGMQILLSIYQMWFYAGNKDWIMIAQPVDGITSATLYE